MSKKNKENKTYDYDIDYSFNFPVFISKLLEIFSPVPRNVTLLIKVLNDKETLGWLKF